MNPLDTTEFKAALAMLKAIAEPLGWRVGYERHKQYIVFGLRFVTTPTDKRSEEYGDQWHVHESMLRDREYVVRGVQAFAEKAVIGVMDLLARAHAANVIQPTAVVGG